MAWTNTTPQVDLRNYKRPLFYRWCLANSYPPVHLNEFRCCLTLSPTNVEYFCRARHSLLSSRIETKTDGMQINCFYHFYRDETNDLLIVCNLNQWRWRVPDMYCRAAFPTSHLHRSRDRDYKHAKPQPRNIYIKIWKNSHFILCLPLSLTPVLPYQVYTDCLSLISAIVVTCDW